MSPAHPLLAYEIIASVVLAAALFLPVRRLIWVIAVRRAERRLDRPTDDGERQALRRRAGWIAALVGLVFSFLYVDATAGRLLGTIAP